MNEILPIKELSKKLCKVHVKCKTRNRFFKKEARNGKSEYR